jgi:transcriptional regulator with XRE-family HTH domain
MILRLESGAVTLRSISVVLLGLLRTLREEAGITQRDLGKRLGKPQSWVYNCETANRRVDLAEFVAWASACEVNPRIAFARFLAAAK